MITSHFKYVCPTSVPEAVEVLASARGKEVSVISGGTWVVPELGHKLRDPAIVLDLRRAGLDTVSTDGDNVVIGATVSYASLLLSSAVPPLLHHMARGITGGSAVRNFGTPLGSACYANPSSDAPGALVASDASIRIASQSGVRDVKAADFFTGAFSTILEPGDLAVATVVPRFMHRRRWAYRKFKTAEGSWPIATAGAVAEESGEVRSVVIGGVSATPVVIRLNKEVNGDEIADLARQAVTEPWSDVLASGNYRRHVSGVLAKRVINDLQTADR